MIRLISDVCGIFGARIVSLFQRISDKFSDFRSWLPSEKTARFVVAGAILAGSYLWHESILESKAQLCNDNLTAAQTKYKSDLTDLLERIAFRDRHISHVASKFAECEGNCSAT